MTAHSRAEDMMDDIAPVDPARSTPAAFHTESPVSPRTARPVPVSQSRKSRVALACKRCKRRKQRCDGAHPSCRSCEKSNSACLYERVLRPHYPGGKSLYISALEERIAFLEARLPDYAEDHFAATSFVATPPEPQAKGPRRDSRDSFSDDEPSSLVDGVAYLSLCASGTTDTAPEPFYLGSSSGATIARMIQSSIFHGSGGRATADAMAASRAAPSRPMQSRENPLEFSSPEELVSEFPYHEQATLLFDVFFDRLHTRWPILDRKLYTKLFEKQYDQGALSIQHRSIMHLVYAISARFLQLMKKPCDVDPQRHLMAAIEPMDYILEQHNLATVQFLLLLAVHGTRSPYGAGAWSQVRYAVTLCIELGLHRKQSNASSHIPRDLEVRRRVFWSCYCLDRMTSVVLGRTFAIADRDINVELPSDGFEFWDLTASKSPSSVATSTWSNMKPFIHIIKLRRMQSKIHRRVYRVDKDVFSGSPEERARLDSKMGAIRAELDEWVRTVPHPPKDAGTISWMYDPESAYHDSRDFFNLQYHKSVLSLFTVLLPTLDTADSKFLTTARSAACVCTAYKRLNQQKTLSYTMLALHSCFIAGLTLVYCLWRDRTLFSYDTLEATRACSQSLTIFGEKFHGAVKYRDIFDALSGSLFKAIVNPLAGPDTGLKPLQVDLEAEPAGSLMAPAMASESGATVRGGGADEKSSVAHAISNAVKEAFMEVDEEAPGGWHSWRMFNEMVQPDLNSRSGQDQVNHDEAGQAGGKWDSLELELGFTEELTQGVDRGMMESDWDFGGLEKLH
ncbi:fungal specific transcription factor domain-containing protein [Colletotrichum orchidophilum]|uniref:Fungal specific transcription factor domain-containing protein n=1 Tax=Colletotrichum orchidophilum TaxID=1209926 RepID=A0A1G4BS83_9PEZI|nr:fungal specific transcription factor domain-containing protein [Colletotrichum orchidophilum]OHF04186.1 fungal specific transcription factor domain-containing protein [Colletotrichum orchidophilum]